MRAVRWAFLSPKTPRPVPGSSAKITLHLLLFVGNVSVCDHLECMTCVGSAVSSCQSASSRPSAELQQPPSTSQLLAPAAHAIVGIAVTHLKLGDPALLGAFRVFPLRRKVPRTQCVIKMVMRPRLQVDSGNCPAVLRLCDPNLMWCRWFRVVRQTVVRVMSAATSTRFVLAWYCLPWCTLPAFRGRRRRAPGIKLRY